MNPRRIYAIFTRYMILLWSNPQRLMQIFVWGTFDVILWGFLTRYLNEVGNAEFSFVPTLLGGIILVDFLSRIQQGTATPALEDIWSNNLLNYFASPLKVSEYILGLIASAMVTTTLAMTLMLTIAALAFDFSILSYGISLGAFLLILFLFGITLGMVGAAIILRYGPSAEWFVWPMIYVLTPFVGVFYPLSILPGWMQLIAHALPPSYVFEGMRALVLGTAPTATPIWFGVVIALIYLVLAGVFFAHMYKIVVRKGLLARYSAESL